MGAGDKVEAAAIPEGARAAGAGKQGWLESGVCFRSSGQSLLEGYRLVVESFWNSGKRLCYDSLF